MIPFSIVMPTYNRRDTILRAISSVRAQRFTDWELIVVDDGSTDGTAEQLEGIDPRVRVIRQDNQGVAGARNTGLAATTGAHIAFLDSDDEWTPHHLALAHAFFRSHPDAQLYTSEFWEDFGHQQFAKHFRPEVGDWYPGTAQRIGSHAFDQPPPQGDPYLWFYQARSELEPWAHEALEGNPWTGGFLYRGHIFRGWRWGWLMALQPTVITRAAMEAVGPNDTSYRVASDFGYLANLCRRFPTHFVSLPGCIKHELGDGASALAESHLATGASAVQFNLDVLRFHEELFCQAAPDDPELAALRGFRHYLVAQAALDRGDHALALAHLDEAVKTYRGPEALRARLLSHAVTQPKLASLLWRGSRVSARLASRLRHAVGLQVRP